MILLLACILKLQFSIACTLYTLSTTFGKGFPNWVLSHTFMFLLFLLNIKVALCIPPLKTNISIEKWWLEDSLHFPLNMGPLKKKKHPGKPRPLRNLACFENRSKADGGNPSHGGLPGHQLALRYQHLATVWVTYIRSFARQPDVKSHPHSCGKTNSWLLLMVVVEVTWKWHKEVFFWIWWMVDWFDILVFVEGGYIGIKIEDLNIFHGDHWN